MALEAVRTKPSAVVFAYHNVGVRALAVLLDAGVDVRLVVTHHDAAGEAIWFASVAAYAAEHGLACIAPNSASDASLLEACQAAAPDFLFSFYYRSMLPASLLAVARRGAFNLHGSLLPRYRGRAPVNWAILRGERETGATLHVMDERPDHGAIVDQCAVPILVDDTARQVFDKVTVAAEIVLARALPGLLDGTSNFVEQRLGEGNYFGRRGAEDGRLPAAATARQIHDLVRAVAPPEYPGAFFDHGSKRIVIASTRLAGAAPGAVSGESFVVQMRDGRLALDASDGQSVDILRASIDGRSLDANEFGRWFGDAILTPDSHPIPCSKS
ncbi:MAG: formyltransferase [Pseudomonadota bacterium]|nr:formyltransferase [Pseudomonadota bacterium]